MPDLESLWQVILIFLSFACHFACLEVTITSNMIYLPSTSCLGYQGIVSVVGSLGTP